MLLGGRPVAWKASRYWSLSGKWTIATSPLALPVPPGGRRLPCALTSKTSPVGVVACVWGAVAVGVSWRVGLGVVVAAEAERQDDRDREHDADAGGDQAPAELGALLDLDGAGGAGVERVEGLGDLLALGGDLGQLAVGERAQRAGDGARPGAAGGRSLEVLARGGALRGGLLAEQVVGDLVAALVVELRRRRGRARRPRRGRAPARRRRRTSAASRGRRRTCPGAAAAAGRRADRR